MEDSILLHWLAMEDNVAFPAVQRSGENRGALGTAGAEAWGPLGTCLVDNLPLIGCENMSLFNALIAV